MRARTDGLSCRAEIGAELQEDRAQPCHHVSKRRDRPTEQNVQNTPVNTERKQALPSSDRGCPD